MLFSQILSQVKVHTGRLSRWLTNNCSGKWSYRINMFCFGLAWLIFPIENRFYQKIVKNRTYYFPQIDFHNLRPLDPIRGIIQLIFLIFRYIAVYKHSYNKKTEYNQNCICNYFCLKSSAFLIHNRPPALIKILFYYALPLLLSHDNTYTTTENTLRLLQQET